MRISTAVIDKLRHLTSPLNIVTDELSLALNSYDCSLSRFRPDVLITVSNSKQVAPILQILHQQGIPFTARAAATNHAGSCVTLYGGAVLNLNALNRILKIDTQAQYALVEPGVINEKLQFELGKLGFFYAPDPASERVCTLGGNLAQNASGARCMKYGNTLDHVLAAELITPDGSVHCLSKQSSGPDLIGLLAGSEGTLGIVTQLRVAILPIAKHIKTFLVSFSSLEDSVQAVSDLVASGITPRCVEAMDKITTQAIEGFAHAGYPLDAEALLIIELDGEPTQINKDAAVLEQVCRKNHCTDFQTAKTEADRQKLWYGRRAAYAAMARLAPNVMVGDGTVPRSQLPAVLKKVRVILNQHHLYASLLFHAGDGNLHPQIIFNEQNKLETRHVTQAIKEILQACADCGGTISGEHGIGVEKRGVMAYLYTKETLRLMGKIKKAFDPQNLSNPGKLLPVDFEEKAADAQTSNPAVLDLCTEIKKRFDSRQPSVIVGTNTQLTMSDSSILSTSDLQKIIDIDKTNYTATVESGVPVKVLLAELKKQGVYARLPQTPGTLGGFISGQTVPEFANQLLGLQAITPNGELVSYGGKLMKNASGYNLCRLFCGAQGTFGLLTQLTFKIYAAKQTPVRVQPFVPLAPSPLLLALKAHIDPQHLFNPFLLQGGNHV